MKDLSCSLVLFCVLKILHSLIYSCLTSLSLSLCFFLKIICITHEHAGTSTPSRKEKDLRGENISREAMPVEPPVDNILASSPIEAAKTPLQTIGEKTLKDAVKPKNKRKKKASSTGGS